MGRDDTLQSLKVGWSVGGRGVNLIQEASRDMGKDKNSWFHPDKTSYSDKRKGCESIIPAPSSLELFR